MCIARKNLINLNKTKYYHCSNRIVRRGFLCGYDPLTNKNYDYRRDWIIKRLHLLSANYAIEVCAYAIMSNHYHLVLKVNLSEAVKMTSAEVIKRWTAVHPSKKELKYMYDTDGILLDLPEVKSTIRTWKKRLLSISYFMSALNYNISRRANKEDGCKGHFWEGRFNSQPLVGNAALLNCMAYVDLNPVRAGVASNLMECHYTSLQARIEALMSAKSAVAKLPIVDIKMQNPTFCPINYQPDNLSIFCADNSFSVIDYLKLVDFKGRQIRTDKKGYLKQSVNFIFDILGINKVVWGKLKCYCNDTDVMKLCNYRMLKIADIDVAAMFK